MIQSWTFCTYFILLVTGHSFGVVDLGIGTSKGPFQSVFQPLLKSHSLPSTPFSLHIYNAIQKTIFPETDSETAIFSRFSQVTRTIRDWAKELTFKVVSIWTSELAPTIQVTFKVDYFSIAVIVALILDPSGTYFSGQRWKRCKTGKWKSDKLDFWLAINNCPNSKKKNLLIRATTFFPLSLLTLIDLGRHPWILKARTSQHTSLNLFSLSPVICSIIDMTIKQNHISIRIFILQFYLTKCLISSRAAK